MRSPQRSSHRKCDVGTRYRRSTQAHHPHARVRRTRDARAALRRADLPRVPRRHAHGVYEASLFSPTQHYEDLLCDCLRTETFRYTSSDQATRVEKLRALADDEGAQRFVAVCYAPSEDGRNCGECCGCWKTMVPLDLLGKLDSFCETFDVPRYRRDRARIFEDFIRFSLRPEAVSARESVRQILALAESDPSEAGDLFARTYRSVMAGR